MPMLTFILVVLAMTPPASKAIADEINRVCELVIENSLSILTQSKYSIVRRS